MNPRGIDINQEISMIFRIVMRNMTLAGWENLLPEAQAQMLEEVAILMSCEYLTRGYKQQLVLRVNYLKNYVTANVRQRLIKIMDDYFEAALGAEKQAS